MKRGKTDDSTISDNDKRITQNCYIYNKSFISYSWNQTRPWPYYPFLNCVNIQKTRSVLWLSLNLSRPLVMSFIWSVQSYITIYKLLGLSDNGYFEDEAFLHYLQYLQYWKQPEYARYLMQVFNLLLTISYPECLYFLDKLQDEAFRYVLFVVIVSWIASYRSESYQLSQPPVSFSYSETSWITQGKEASVYGRRGKGFRYSV